MQRLLRKCCRCKVASPRVASRRAGSGSSTGCRRRCCTTTWPGPPRRIFPHHDPCSSVFSTPGTNVRPLLWALPHQARPLRRQLAHRFTRCTGALLLVVLLLPEDAAGVLLVWPPPAAAAGPAGAGPDLGERGAARLGGALLMAAVELITWARCDFLVGAWIRRSRGRDGDPADATLPLLEHIRCLPADQSGDAPA